jgi:hypothetical protein
MMVVLLFLFQFSSVILDLGNDYGFNHYAQNAHPALSASQSVVKPGWNAVDQDPEEALSQLYYEEYAMFCGDAQNSKVVSAVREWAMYAKFPLVYVDSLSDWNSLEYLPSVIFMDWSDVDTAMTLPVLRECVDAGVTLISCNLPSYESLRRSMPLRTLLGIRNYVTPEAQVTGYHMFGGFLIGGEVIYEPEDEEEREKRFDLATTIPWYQTGSAVETYMVAYVEDEVINDLLGEDADVALINNALPAIIWQHSLKDSRIFCVNGDYMESDIGIGLICAMMTQTKSYDLYPIVNAQSTAVVGFPWIAGGDNAVLREVYGRSQSEVLRDIVWPGIMAIMENNQSIPTCLMVPQLSYSENSAPTGKDLIYYMKLLGEEQAETGGFIPSDPSLPTIQKIQTDDAFLSENIPDYRFVSYAQGTLSNEEWNELISQEILTDLRTLILPPQSDETILSYRTQNITAQKTISDGFIHTYSDDLLLRSVETILGYSAIYIDMETIAAPLTQEDTWEERYEDLAANTKTYWNPFRGFESTSFSQSDERARRFLSLDYSQTRIDQTIRLNITAFEQEAFFLLRLPYDELNKIQGGSYKKIEEGVYLITATRDHVEIELKEKQQPFYYE